MIKTFNINLAGQIFNINEDAYELLSGYFNSLRTFYKDEEEKDEIIRDIEARFAELFLAKGKNYIVTKEDASEVVNMMGNPQEFDGDRNEENTSAASSHTTQSSAATGVRGKRLYRDPDNSIVAGVCSGISSYLGISDPIWVRIAFILFTIFTGGIWVFFVYPILWFIVPEAVTSAQKLEMKGEQINISNIEKQVKDETVSTEPKGVFSRMIAFLGSGVLLFFKVILWIGIAFAVLIGGLLLFSFFVLLIAVSGIALFGIPVVNNYFFSNASDGWFLGMGGLLVGIIPIIFIITALVHLISKKTKPLKKQVIFPLLGLFLFGLLLLNISGYHAKQLMSEKKRINQTFPLNYGYKSDTLQITMNPAIRDEKYNNVNINGVSDLMDFISDHNDKFFPVDIEIYPSVTDSFTIVKEYSASGSSNKEAIENATRFTHTISQINNKLVIDPYIQFGENEKVKFRNQKLKIKVYVPEGKVIRWDKRTEEYMDVSKLAINWDNIRHAAPPVPPMPPLPPGAHKKINIRVGSNNDPNSTIVINIDKNKDVDAELEKAQEKLDAAREKLQDAQENTEDQLEETQDSIQEAFESRLQRQHYIFKMHNGELIAID